MIEFRNVTKQFGAEVVAVRSLSLTVATGSITVFVGPSGCGKTTSLRMVNRMIDPTSGTVFVDGRDVMKSDPPTLRRGIGYVIQQAGLFPHRTVLDNIATVPRLSGQTKAAARRRAGELLELVGLDADLGPRYPAQLSGGQQQRVGVARALAADPPLLLMDEPFSAVDPLVREELQDQLLRLHAELGKTIIFVTHDIDEAIRIGEKVAVFRTGGVLAQYAPPIELLTRPHDDFVASFVGKDRGYRRLSFVDATGVEIQRAPTLPQAELAQGQTVAPVSHWRLLLDDQSRPRGWLPPNARSQPIPGGSLYVVGAAVRGALDAVLSSPTGQGVAIDSDGRFAGVLDGRQILDVIERHYE